MSEPLLPRLEDRNYWLELAPGHKISEHPFANPKPFYQLDQQTSERIRQQMISDGYFQLEPIIDADEISQLKSLVQTLRDAGIMPLFACVYDDFWRMLYRVSRLLTPILGEDYRLVPDFWIWHVEADDEIAGWGPHRDGAFVNANIRNDGSPTLCTAWIPLSDVETSNSCMYILPRKHDALFQDFVRKRFGQPGIPDADRIPLPLSRIRALPARAGSIMGWDQNLLHWGSGSSQWAKEPRISIGVYYQATDANIAGKQFDPLGHRYVNYADPKFRLDLPERLTIAANNMETYRNQLDSGSVHEPCYNDFFKAFRSQWQWPHQNLEAQSN